MKKVFGLIERYKKKNIPTYKNIELPELGQRKKEGFRSKNPKVKFMDEI